MFVINHRGHEYFPFATTGEPMPSPKLAAHLTLSLAVNSVGRGASDFDTPEELGPLNWGQSSAETPTVTTERMKQVMQSIIFIFVNSGLTVDV